MDDMTRGAASVPARLDQRPTRPARGAAWAVAGLAALSAGAALALRRRARPQRRLEGPPPVTLRVAKDLNRSAALLGLAALADSAVEHYRGSFHNPAMVTPLAVSTAVIGVSLFGTLDDRPRAHAVRDAAYGGAILTGAVGTGFHLFNVTKRPGGLSWLNLFYGAPIGAPSAVALAGLLGFFAERVRHTRPGEAPAKAPKVLGVPAADALAALVSLGILGTVAETALLHFRGAFHDPAMYLPMVVPPVGAALLAGTVLSGNGRPAMASTRAARWGLRATAALGFVGVGFHAFGVHRNMGGWRNWSQNILNGPPLPAPPSYTALALAGLATLSLEEDRRHAR
ncbi:hypothetical protein [Azospirillum canadense]|uniref:hypothetical protein n=1 Tax=Azospirillum canadense TaxID=403962 RepID=UPI0022278ED2|nr:hypothetical protein [Azospirillum canadense]MCW2239966.1 hypothetical protein [Azospirillum canadense]